MVPRSACAPDRRSRFQISNAVAMFMPAGRRKCAASQFTDCRASIATAQGPRRALFLWPDRWAWQGALATEFREKRDAQKLDRCNRCVGVFLARRGPSTGPSCHLLPRLQACSCDCVFPRFQWEYLGRGCWRIDVDQCEREWIPRRREEFRGFSHTRQRGVCVAGPDGHLRYDPQDNMLGCIEEHRSDRTELDSTLGPGWSRRRDPGRRRRPCDAAADS